MKEWIKKIEDAIEYNRKRKIHLTQILAEVKHCIGVYGGIHHHVAMRLALDNVSSMAFQFMMIDRMDYKRKIAYLIHERLVDIPDAFWINKETVSLCEDLEESYNSIRALFDEYIDIQINMTVNKT